jgi:hypothetical protein
MAENRKDGATFKPGDRVKVRREDNPWLRHNFGTVLSGGCGNLNCCSEVLFDRCTRPQLWSNVALVKTTGQEIADGVKAARQHQGG